MNHRYFALICMFLLISTSSVFAQAGTKDGELDAGTMDELFVRVNSGMGIDIEGSDTDKISYEYEFEGNKEAYDRYFKGFEPQFKKNGGYAEFVIQYPERSEKNVSYQISKNHLTIRLPRRVKLNLETKYSTIRINDIDKDLEVHNRSGSVAVENVGQSLKIFNQYGDIAARNIQSDVTIDGRSSRIDVTEVTGMVKISSNYSKMNISKIDGNVDLENRSGVINAFEIKGDFTAKTDYSEIELTYIEGNTRLHSKSGNISVEDIHALSFTGDYTNVKIRNIKSAEMVDIQGRSATVRLDNINARTTVNGNYLEIHANNITDDLEISNRSGSVEVENLKGRFNFQGEYSDVILKKFQGNILSINSRSGTISIEALKKLSRVAIESEYGTVTLALKESYAGKVMLASTYGTINHNFELKNTSYNTGGQQTLISGHTGGESSNSLSIKNKNGDIIIKGR